MLNSSSKHSLQNLIKIAHVPAVAYACVELKEGSKDKFASSSLVIGDKDAQSTDAKKNKVNDKTRFPASSLSKIVFTYLVLQLVEKGHLSLDDKLHRILPNKRFLVDGNYPDKATRLKAKNLKVKHVLSHTTGLPNMGPNWTPDTTLPLTFDSKTKLGEGYSYSGEAIYYLQQVIEKKMSKVLKRNVTLEDLAQAYVFEPLKMQHSTFLPQPEDDNIVKVHTELGKSTKINENAPHLNIPNAAGSLLTTADDFSKFTLAWLENMDKATFKKAFMPNSADAMSCGLGWHLYREEKDEAEDKLIAYQYGENTDTRAFIAIDVNAKKAAAFFTNSENGMSIANQIFNSPNLVPIGDLRKVYKVKQYPQCDEPGWKKTLEGKIAEEKDKVNKARRCYKKAVKEARKLSPGDESKQQRLDWFNAAHASSRKKQSFERKLESFVGKFTNRYNDLMEISISKDDLQFKEADREIKLVRISETDFLPEKDQSFKISFDGDKITKHYLDGPSKFVAKEVELPKAPVLTSSYASIPSLLGTVLSSTSDTPIAESTVADEDRLEVTKLEATKSIEKDSQRTSEPTAEVEETEHEVKNPDSGTPTHRFK